MKTALLASALLLCLSITAAAASIEGKWTAEVPGRDGLQTTTFTFQSSNGKVEGTVVTKSGESPMSNVTFDGSTVKFKTKSTFQGKEITMTYAGRIQGDVIEFTRAGRGGPVAFTAKRAP